MIIAVWGSGGVGKTILAIHLAKALANEGSVLIIAGAMTHCSIRNWFQCVHSQKSISKVFRNIAVLKENIENTKHKNISIIDSSIADNCIANSKTSDQQVTDLLVEANRIYKYILVDCSAAFDNVITRTALLEGDRVVFLLEPSLESISFYKSHKFLLDKLKIEEKTMYVLNKHRGQVSPKIIEKEIDLKLTTHINYERSFYNLPLHGELAKKAKAKKYFDKVNFLAEEIRCSNE